MPYKSKAQFKWMHINKPEIAEKWDDEGYDEPKKQKKTKFKKLDGVVESWKKKKYR